MATFQGFTIQSRPGYDFTPDQLTAGLASGAYTRTGSWIMDGHAPIGYATGAHNPSAPPTFDTTDVNELLQLSEWANGLEGSSTTIDATDPKVITFDASDPDSDPINLNDGTNDDAPVETSPTIPALPEEEGSGNAFFEEGAQPGETPSPWSNNPPRDENNFILEHSVAINPETGQLQYFDEALWREQNPNSILPLSFQVQHKNADGTNKIDGETETTVSGGGIDNPLAPTGGGGSGIGGSNLNFLQQFQGLMNFGLTGEQALNALLPGVLSGINEGISTGINDPTITPNIDMSGINALDLSPDINPEIDTSGIDALNLNPIVNPTLADGALEALNTQIAGGINDITANDINLTGTGGLYGPSFEQELNALIMQGVDPLTAQQVLEQNFGGNLQDEITAAFDALQLPDLDLTAQTEAIGAVQDQLDALGINDPTLIGLMDDLGTSIGGLSGDITGVNSGLNNLQSALFGGFGGPGAFADVNTNIDNTSAHLSGLLGGMDTTLGGMDTTLGGIGTTLGGMDSTLAGLLGGVNGLSTGLFGGFGGPGALSGINDNIDNASAHLSGLLGGLGGDLGALGGDLGALYAALLGGPGGEGALGGLSSDLSGIGTTLSGMDTALGGLGTSVGGLGSGLQTLTQLLLGGPGGGPGALGALGSSIGLDISGLGTTLGAGIGGLGSSLGGLQTDLFGGPNGPGALQLLNELVGGGFDTLGGGLNALTGSVGGLDSSMGTLLEGLFGSGTSPGTNGALADLEGLIGGVGTDLSNLPSTFEELLTAGFGGFGDDVLLPGLQDILSGIGGLSGDVAGLNDLLAAQPGDLAGFLGLEPEHIEELLGVGLDDANLNFGFDNVAQVGDLGALSGGNIPNSTFDPGFDVGLDFAGLDLGSFDDFTEPLNFALLDEVLSDGFLNPVNPFDARRDEILAGPNSRLQHAFDEAADLVAHRAGVLGNEGSSNTVAQLGKLGEEFGRSRGDILSRFGLEAARLDEPLKLGRLSTLASALNNEQNRVGRELSLRSGLERDALSDFLNILDQGTNAVRGAETFADQGLSLSGGVMGSSINAGDFANAGANAAGNVSLAGAQAAQANTKNFASLGAGLGALAQAFGGGGNTVSNPPQPNNPFTTHAGSGGSTLLSNPHDPLGLTS